MLTREGEGTVGTECATEHAHKGGRGNGRYRMCYWACSQIYVCCSMLTQNISGWLSKIATHARTLWWWGFWIENVARAHDFFDNQPEIFCNLASSQILWACSPWHVKYWTKFYPRVSTYSTEHTHNYLLEHACIWQWVEWVKYVHLSLDLWSWCLLLFREEPQVLSTVAPWVATATPPCLCHNRPSVLNWVSKNLPPHISSLMYIVVHLHVQILNCKLSRTLNLPHIDFLWSFLGIRGKWTREAQTTQKYYISIDMMEKIYRDWAILLYVYFLPIEKQHKIARNCRMHLQASILHTRSLSLRAWGETVPHAYW